MSVSGGNVIVQNGQLNVSAGIYGDSDTFYIDSENDRVGVGTTAPTNKLRVNPDNADNDGIVLDGYQSSLGSIKNSINNGAFFELTDVNGTRTHMFRSYGNSYMNTGYVGIGTISPLYQLHINSSTNPGMKLETDSNDLYPYLIIDSNRSSGTVNTTGEISFQNNADSIAYIKVYEDGAADAGTIRIGTQPTGGSVTDRLTINSSGHVGIGTNDPSARLHISEPSGATNLDLLMESGSGKYWNMRVGYTSGNLYLSNMTTLTDYRVTFTPAGKVGIGTTNPNQLLDVYGLTRNISISNTAETPSGILFLDADAPTTQYGKILWDAGSTQGGTAYTLGFYIASTSPDLLIDSNGYVGIGTTSPQRTLHIKNDLPYLVWEESDVGNKTWQMGGYSGLLTIWENMATIRFTIQNETGYVGIGTSAPNDLLEIKNGSLRLSVSGTSTYSTIRHSGISDADGNRTMVFENSQQTSDLVYNFISTMGGDRESRLAILRGGNIGIGTTEPDNELDVRKSTGSTISVGSSDNVGAGTNFGQIDFRHETVSYNDSVQPFARIAAARPALGAKADLTFSTRSDTSTFLERMRITQFGKVGIGTASPELLLDVEGDIEIGTGTTGCVRDSDNTTIVGTCSSDIRLKQDVESLDGVLENVSLLRPVSFKWIGGNVTEYGLIAQEVREVMPELVSVDDEGYLRVSYDSKLFMLMLESIRELKEEKDTEIEALRRDNEALKQAVCETDPGADFCREL